MAHGYLYNPLSYRDAAAHTDELERTPSKDTIRDRMTDCGWKLTEFVSGCIAGREAETVIPDGTNCYSQDEDGEHHDIRVTLAEDTDAGHTVSD